MIQAPISMGFGAQLPAAKLTFLSRLCATSGAPHCQGLLLSGSHGYIMRVYSVAGWGSEWCRYGAVPQNSLNPESSPPLKMEVLFFLKIKDQARLASRGRVLPFGRLPAWSSSTSIRCGFQ